MSGEVKDELQGKIREDGGKRWSEHTYLKEGDSVQLQNLKGRHPLRSDYNGTIVGKNNLNSYSMKFNGTDRVTVRNRASLCRILPPVPIHNLESVQDMNPVQSVMSVAPAGSRRQAGSLGAGLGSSVRSRNNIFMSGDTAGSREQREVDSGEQVLRAASEMANPGILRVLRSSARAEPGAESVPVQCRPECQSGAGH